MMPSTLMLRLLGVAVIALAMYGAYWSIDRKGYQRGASEVESKYQAAELKAAKEHAERLKNAQEKHDADQKTIARLAAESRRLRVNFPVCSSSSEGSNGGSGILSTRVDELFAELQGRTGSLVERCDELNIEVIRQNASLP